MTINSKADLVDYVRNLRRGAQRAVYEHARVLGITDLRLVDGFAMAVGDISVDEACAALDRLVEEARRGPRDDRQGHRER